MFEKLKSRLRQEEGGLFAGQFLPYDDATGKPLRRGDTIGGNITLGYGCNISDRGISKTTAEQMLEERINVAIDDTKFIFFNFWTWTENRQVAILDVMFAIGRPSFLGFKKMIQAIKNDDWEEASRQLLDSEWAGDVGQRAKELAELLKGEIA